MHQAELSTRVAIFDKIAPKGLKLLQGGLMVADRLDNPHGIVVRSTKIDTGDYPNLLAIARAGVGVDNIDGGTFEKATARGICVLYAPGANANSVNELTFTLLGGCARNVYAARDFVQGIDSTLTEEGIHELVEKSKKQFAGFELLGRAFGVIGMGNIGRLVAKGALARGMEVFAYDPMLTTEQWEQVDPAITRVMSVSDIFRKCNVVSLHVTSTKETRHLIDAEAMTDMREGTVLINLSREPICEEEAVLRHLESKKLATFITDFPTRRTLRHDKVICTPHIGASTEEAEERCAIMACRELVDYLKFGIVVNSVNFPTMEIRPRPGIRMRLAIPHKNVPGMVALISDTIRDAGANIGPLHNDTKNGLGYCVVDMENVIDDEKITYIKSQPNIFDVRMFRF